MVINFSKKALSDYSVAILSGSFMMSKGNPARKLTASAMVTNTDSSKESDISLDIFQFLSQRDAAVSGEKSQLLSDDRAQVLRRADGHLIRPESIFAGCTAGVSMHEPQRTTRKQNKHNIWIFKIIH
ncbi:hypothetical protein AMECASPLE_024937 [Ameca splendens]|uniref:Uncharacterized protein n=1 Tax=Ameca splendens TaxID=208324 RepID=A0ABV0Z3C5_9TELE